MNPLVERYVYDVIRRLPEREREEVRAELLSNIEAMLPKNPADEDVVRVLESLGPPYKMADQYRSTKRYLISPAMFDSYIMVLKIVGTVLFSVTLVASVIGIAVEYSQNPTAVGFVTKTISTIFASLFEAAVSTFAWVTLGFALFEHYGKGKQKSWNVKDLPQMPKPERISRRSSIVTMVFTVVLNVAWVVVILRYADQIAWYQTGHAPVPLFHADILISMVPIIIGLAVFSLLLCIGKVIYGSWNYPLAVVSMVYNIANAVYVAYFLNYSHVFNEAIFAKLAGVMKVSTQAVAQGFSTGVLVITVLVALGAISDTIKAFYQAYRNAR